VHLDGPGVVLADVVAAAHVAVAAEHQSEVVLADDTTTRAEQIEEDVELAAGELDVVVVDRHDAHVGVQSQPPVRKPALVFGGRRRDRRRRRGDGDRAGAGRIARDGPARAPHHRLDASAQLSGAEGLGDVVVGAGLQAQQRVDLIGARREHHDVGVAEGPDALRRLVSVHSRHRHVESRHDRVVGADEFDAVQARRRREHRETGLLENRRDQ
jgi:hypothetical protein